MKLFPGLNILFQNLRVCYLLFSLEKLKTKTVSTADSGSRYEGRYNILTEARHFYSYFSHFTDTENNPKYTVRYSEHFRTWAADRTGALLQIPRLDFQEVCNRLLSVSVCLSFSVTLSLTHTSHFTTGCLYSFIQCQTLGTEI